MELLDLVTLIQERPEDGLPAGAQGTIVHVFDHPIRAYEVEFSDEQSNDILVTVRPHEIRAATDDG